MLAWEAAMNSSYKFLPLNFRLLKKPDIMKRIITIMTWQTPDTYDNIIPKIEALIYSSLLK